MANIKSAKKRIKVAAIRTAKNKSIRSQVKTAIKKVDAAVLAGDKTLAASTLHDAIVTIDKAAAKGVYHKNNSSRKISKLTKSVNTMA